MGKIIIGIACLFCFTGCGTGLIKTTVKSPQGKTYEVKSKSDAMVSFKNKDAEITVDNRGKASMLEDILNIMLLKTNVELSNKPGRD